VVEGLNVIHLPVSGQNMLASYC